MMKYLTPTLLFTLCLLSITCSNAQLSETEKIKIEANFKDKYPDAKKVSWGKDSHGNYEAKFEQNDEKYRADFSPTGDWIETENNIKFKQLPKVVQEAVEKNYDKDDIEEIEKVNHFQKGLFYDVEFNAKGSEKIDIEYNGLGKIIGKEF